ncbi:hypothetical protein BC826DRAFT_395708 [Russula brevipes]|nr:hypothetical protein BC826DRAFT_395708 [Russula brevipes]
MGVKVYTTKPGRHVTSAMPPPTPSLACNCEGGCMQRRPAATTPDFPLHLQTREGCLRQRPPPRHPAMSSRHRLPPASAQGVSATAPAAMPRHPRPQMRGAASATMPGRCVIPDSPPPPLRLQKRGGCSRRRPAAMPPPHSDSPSRSQKRGG